MQTSNISIRVNGIGNAWPVLLGSAKNNLNLNDLANSSYSIIKSQTTTPIADSTDWDVLIDAGQGIIQFYLLHFNRIPDAIIITHPHLDHTCSIDWIIQSYFRIHNKEKRYPLYCSQNCYETIIRLYPQLKSKIKFNELKYGLKTNIEEAKGLSITAFPVYHGPDTKGACMYLAEINNKKMLFTGDLLTPILRKDDLDRLKKPDYVFADSNNRFPCPTTNHWSICKNYNQKNHLLEQWFNTHTMNNIISPHLSDDNSNNSFLTDFQKTTHIKDLITNQFDLYAKIQPKQVNLIHYSGLQDIQFYNEAVLNNSALKDWANEIKHQHKLSSIKFDTPVQNDIYCLTAHQNTQTPQN